MFQSTARLYFTHGYIEKWKGLFLLFYWLSSNLWKQHIVTTSWIFSFLRIQSVSILPNFACETMSNVPGKWKTTVGIRIRISDTISQNMFLKLFNVRPVDSLAHSLRYCAIPVYVGLTFALLCGHQNTLNKWKKC